MEPSFRQYRFFVICKGRNTGVFTSFEEVSRQIVDFPDAEYEEFNYHSIAVSTYRVRLQAIQCEREAFREMIDKYGTHDSSLLRTNQTVPTSNSYRAPLSWIVNAIPQSEATLSEFPITVSKEEWLLKACYNASLPPLAFSQNEIAIENGSINYNFTMVLLENPLGPHVFAKGRYSPIESDAREDVTFTKLEKVLDATGRQIRDYHYYKCIMLTRANDSSPDLISS